jgi:4-amino-4-deoxychorismate lyase
MRVDGVERDSISVLDRALQCGDGLFETLRVRDARPEFLPRHLARLRSGCRRLRFPPIAWTRLSSEVQELAGQTREGVLKIMLTRGQSERGYRFAADQQATRVLTLAPLPAWPAQLAQRGIRVRTCATRLCAQPALAGIKHLNRLEQVLARAEWDEPDIHKGLVLDREGNLIEGTMSNVFVVRGDTLLTPSLTACGVAGIMRSVILDLARHLDIAVQIRPLSLQQAQHWSEVFVCNSLIGIWAVRRIDDLAEYPRGPLTETLCNALAARRESDQDNWYSS